MAEVIKRLAEQFEPLDPGPRAAADRKDHFPRAPRRRRWPRRAAESLWRRLSRLTRASPPPAGVRARADEFEQRARAYDSELFTLLRAAADRARFDVTTTHERSETETSSRELKGSLSGQALWVLLGTGVVAIVAGLGIELAGDSQVLDWLGRATIALGALIELVGGAFGVSAVWRQERQRSVRRTLTRDGSMASLKQDLEDILGLLRRDDSSCPRQYRLVVVLDELDKLDRPEMLDGVIQSFKNLFTLSGATFVFITDKDYFDEIGRRSRESAANRTYAVHHTFFTSRIFLRRPEFKDMRKHLDQIRDREETFRTFEAGWGIVADALIFESRNHFYDLVRLLSDQPGAQDDRPYVALQPDSRIGQTTVERAAEFQRMVSIAYVRQLERAASPGALQNELLSQLYTVFDQLPADSFTFDDLIPPALSAPSPSVKTGEPADSDGADEDNAGAADREEIDAHTEDLRARLLAATEELLVLLVTCGALENGGAIEYRKASFRWVDEGLIKTPEAEMLDCVRPFRELVDETGSELAQLEARVQFVR